MTTPDGHVVEVRRRWAPWRLHTQMLRRVFGRMWGEPVNNDSDKGLLTPAVGGSPAEAKFFQWLVLIIVGGLCLGLTLAVEALVLVLVGIPLFAAARLLSVAPWVVETRFGGQVLSSQKVRGWRDSRDLISDVTAAYQRGERRLTAIDG